MPRIQIIVVPSFGYTNDPEFFKNFGVTKLDYLERTCRQYQWGERFVDVQAGDSQGKVKKAMGVALGSVPGGIIGLSWWHVTDYSWLSLWDKTKTGRDLLTMTESFPRRCLVVTYPFTPPTAGHVALSLGFKLGWKEALEERRRRGETAADSISLVENDAERVSRLPFDTTSP